MKILFLIPRMCGGGAERVVANLANEFAKRGESVVIYTPTDCRSFYKLAPLVKVIGENYSVSHKKAIRRLKLMINGTRFWLAYKNRINSESPDVIISFLTEMNLIALTHKYKNCRLIVSERNDPTAYGRMIQWVIKHLYAKADYLVCQSKTVARYFNCDNTVVIQNPIDTVHIPKFYIGERRKVIASIGRLTSQKNFTILIDAFSMLSGRFNEYTLEIYGEGPLEKQLAKQIMSLGLTGRVKLLGAKKDVLKFIADVEIFVMSSDYEGFPNALVEAMAIGLPVICTDFFSGTARELISEKNGVLVAVGDSRAIAEAMENMLSNPEKMKRMSLENLKIREKLSVSKIADVWYKILE